MIQAPELPAPPFDPNLLVTELVPFVALVGALVVGAFLLKWFLRSPIADAIAEGIRLRRRRRWGHLVGEGAGEPGAHDDRRVGVLEDQVNLLQGQVSELAERLDFAERMLAERGERKLSAGP